MPPEITDSEQRLTAAYREAALQISRSLQDFNGRNKASILRRISLILAELDRMSAEFLQSNLPAIYKDGADEALRELRQFSGFDQVNGTFGEIHTEAIKQLVSDATLKFANALEAVRRESVSALRTAEKQQVMQKIVTNEIQGKNATGDVKQALADAGITALRSKNRTWTLEDYSAMLVATVTADAHNTGAAIRYAENGVGFAQVIERSTAPDPTCQFMSGKVISLADRRLLPPYHPHCRGGIKPFLGEPDKPLMSADDPRIPGDVRKMLVSR